MLFSIGAIAGVLVFLKTRVAPPSAKNNKFWNKWWFRCIISFVLGVILCAGVYELFASDQTEGQAQTVSTTQLQSQGNNESGDIINDNNQGQDKRFSKENAIKYLDKNEQWKKDSLEQYPVLQGLFDYMNNYKFDEIIALETELGDSERFKTLLEDVKRYRKADFVVPYNKNENDFVMTVSTYKKILKDTWKKKHRKGVTATGPGNKDRGRI